MTQVDNGATATYIYDAFSRRVRVNAGTNSRECVFDLGGNCIAKFGGSNGSWLGSDIYALGQSIANYANGTTYFIHVDQIGSTRAESTVAGTANTTCTYDPFGSTFNCSGAGNTSSRDFTGYDHDNESNLEHSWFRQYNSIAGRYMSPDPYAGSIDITNPQSINRYAYVMNAVLAFTDPLGLQTCLTPSGQQPCRNPAGPLPNAPEPDDHHQNDDRPQPPADGGDGPWYDGSWFTPPTIYVCFGCLNVQPKPMPQKPQPSPNKGKQKSPARQKCEENAQQKFAQAIGEVKQSFKLGFKVGVIVSAIGNGLVGCAVGAGVGGVIGGAATGMVGGEGAALGIPAGCGAGGFANIISGLPSSLVYGLVGGALSSFPDVYKAYQQEQTDLQVCEQY